MKTCTAVKFLFLLSILASTANAGPTIDIVLNPMNCILCKIFNILIAISGMVALVVIILAGVKWIGSMEDVGARAQAKTSIVNAIVGLLIVMMAIEVIGWLVAGMDGFNFDPLEFLPVAAGGNECNTFCT